MCHRHPLVAVAPARHSTPRAMHAARSLATSSFAARAVASPRPASRRSASADPRAVRAVRAVSSSGDARSDDASSSAPSAPVVALVTTSGCPHCRRAKTALDAANVAFVEIDASAPDGAILDASRAASGMRTVPQVFVGGAIFGGADDLEAGLASGEFASALDAASRDRRPAAPPDLARAVRTAEETAAKTDAKTAAETRDRTAKTDAETRDRTAATVAADDSPDDTPDDSPDDSPDDPDFAALDALVTRMSRELTPTDRWTFGGWRAPLKRERACVDGATIFAWLESRAKSDTSDEGSDVRRASDDALARALTDARLVSCVDSSHPLLNDPRRLYRLADHASSPRAYPGRPAAPLNARRRWRGARRDARVVAASLRERVLALYDAYLSSDGSRVDYAGMRASPAFDAYVDAAAELQTVDVHALTRAERVAFFLNVYNALVVHVTAVVGTPVGLLRPTLVFRQTRLRHRRARVHVRRHRTRRVTRQQTGRGVVGGDSRRAGCVAWAVRVGGSEGGARVRADGPEDTFRARVRRAVVSAHSNVHRRGAGRAARGGGGGVRDRGCRNRGRRGDDARGHRVENHGRVVRGGFRERRRRETSRARGVRPGERRRRKSHREGVGRGGEGAPPVRLETREYDWTLNGDA